MSWPDPMDDDALAPSIILLSSAAKPSVPPIPFVTCYVAVKQQLDDTRKTVAELKRLQLALSKQVFVGKTAKELENVIDSLCIQVGDERYIGQLYLGIEANDHEHVKIYQQQGDELITEREARQNAEEFLQQREQVFSDEQKLRYEQAKTLQAEVDELKRQRDEALKELSSVRQEIRTIEAARYDAEVTLKQLEAIRRFFEQRPSLLRPSVVKESDIDFVKLLEKQEQKYAEAWERERKSQEQNRKYYEERLAEEKRRNGMAALEQMQEKARELQEETKRLQAELAEQTKRVASLEQENRQLVEQTAQLQAVNERFVPGGTSKGVAVALFAYMEKIEVALGKKMNEGETSAVIPTDRQPCWSVQLSETIKLIYGYNLSDVKYYYEELKTWMAGLKPKPSQQSGKERVLSADILRGFAGVLGYSNLYRYFLQTSPKSKEGQFFRLLRDFSVSTSAIQGYSSEVKAASSSWLAGNLPPRRELPNNPDCVVLSTIANPGDGFLAAAIIEYELHNLLDFRLSLYVALQAHAPWTPKEGEEQDIDNVPLQEHHLQVLNYGQVVTDMYDRPITDGCHIIRYQYSGIAIKGKVAGTLAFNNKGELLSEEQLEAIFDE